MKAILAAFFILAIAQTFVLASNASPQDDRDYFLRIYHKRFPVFKLDDYANGALMFSADAGLTEEESRAVTQTLFATLARWLPAAKRPLDAARTLVAFTHGFVMMEQSGAFRLGGDLDSAFEFGLARLLDSLEAHAGRAAERRLRPL